MMPGRIDPDELVPLLSNSDRVVVPMPLVAVLDVAL
jgi:hypothetical protein